VNYDFHDDLTPEEVPDILKQYRAKVKDGANGKAKHA
jgi:hypothetical protein